MGYVLSKSIVLVLTTIWIAWLGSIIGSIMVLPFVFMCSKTTIKKSYIYIPVRISFFLIRSFLPILFAYMFSFLFSPQATGAITTSILVWTVMTKWIYEKLDGINEGPFTTMTSFGATKWESFIEECFLK
jgi:phosphonate transport system permease protein